MRQEGTFFVWVDGDLWPDFEAELKRERVTNWAGVHKGMGTFRVQVGFKTAVEPGTEPAVRRAVERFHKNHPDATCFISDEG